VTTFVEHHETLSGRTWGDGANRAVVHSIADISFAHGAIICQCGEDIYATAALALSEAYDEHRGVLVANRAVREAVVLADDAEVHDFLMALDDPDYVPPFVQTYAGGKGEDARRPGYEYQLDEEVLPGQTYRAAIAAVEADPAERDRWIERLREAHLTYDPDCEACVKLRRLA
jgi:hypothetical protein